MLMLALDRETEDLRHIEKEEILDLLYSQYEKEDDTDSNKGVYGICIAIVECLFTNGLVDTDEDILVKNYLLKFGK